MVNMLGRNSAARLAAPQSRQIWMRVGAPILLLVAAVMAGAFIVLGDFARSEDEDWRAQSRALVQGAITGAQRASVATVVDTAYWNQSYDAITRHWDTRWLQANLFSAAADGLIVYRPGDKVRYTWFRDVDPRSQGSFAALIARQVSDPAAIRAVEWGMLDHEAVIERFVALDGHLAVVAAAPVSFDTAAQRRASGVTHPRDYLAAVDFFAPAEIARLAEALRLHDLHFTADGHGVPTPAGFVSLEVRNPDGKSVGVFAWKDDRPGSGRFAHRALSAAILLLSIGAAAIFAARMLVVRHVEFLTKAEMDAEVTQMKAQFIATMGHALRTPLDAVIGYAELMSEFIEDDPSAAPEIRSDAERINEAARQLMRVVNEILDHAKLEAGHLPLRLEPLSATYVLAGISDAVKDKALARGNTFDVRADDPALTAYADHARLAQALLALVDRAIRSTEDGAIEIRARPAILHGRPAVSFEVKDTGVPIPEDVLEYLFTPFAQSAENAARFDYVDSGLGLSTARRVALAMGGDVLAKSAQGRGTVLSMVLPAAHAAQQAA